MQTCGIPSYKNAHEQDSATSATAASAPRLSSVKAEIIAYRIARRNDYPGSCSSFVNAGLQLRVWSTPRCNHLGVSSSGKTQHFDCCITGSIPVAPVPGYSFTFTRRKLQSRCYLSRRIDIAQCQSSDAGAQDRVAQMAEQFKKRRLKNILTARAKSVPGSSPGVVNK